jgi:hypothetical protein
VSFHAVRIKSLFVVLYLKNKKIITLRVLTVRISLRFASKPFVVLLVARWQAFKVGCAKPATNGLILTIAV